MSNEPSSSQRIVSSPSSSSSCSSLSPSPSPSPYAKPNAKKKPDTNKKAPKGYPKAMVKMIVNNKMPWGQRWGNSSDPPPTAGSEVATFVIDRQGNVYSIPLEAAFAGKDDHYTLTSPSLPFMAPIIAPTPVISLPSPGEYLHPSQRQRPPSLNLNLLRPPTAASVDGSFLLPYSRGLQYLSSSPHPSEGSSVSSYPSGSSVSEAFWFGDQQGMPYELEPLPPSAASFSEGGWDDTFNFYSLDYNQVERNYEHSESSDLGAQFDQALLFQQQVPIAQYPRASGMPVASESSQYRLAQALDQNQIGNFPLTTGSSFGVWTGHNGFVPVNGGDRTASRERSVQRMAPNTGNPEWPY